MSRHWSWVFRYAGLASSHFSAYRTDRSFAFVTFPHHLLPLHSLQSDTLFPIEQQRELSESLKRGGNNNVVYYESNSPYGHDGFLLEVATIGGAVKGFLEQDVADL